MNSSCPCANDRCVPNSWAPRRAKCEATWSISVGQCNTVGAHECCFPAHLNRTPYPRFRVAWCYTGMYKWCIWYKACCNSTQREVACRRARHPPPTYTKSGPGWYPTSFLLFACCQNTPSKQPYYDHVPGTQLHVRTWPSRSCTHSVRFATFHRRKGKRGDVMLPLPCL